MVVSTAHVHVGAMVVTKAVENRLTLRHSLAVHPEARRSWRTRRSIISMS